MRVRRLAALPPATVLAVGPLGFVEAAEEDRRRWLAGFRALLDGLEAPLQVVIGFSSGGAAPPASDLAPSPVERRQRDLDFARRLAAGAQRRELYFATRTPQPGLERALRELRLPWLERVEWLAPPGLLVGVERPGWLCDGLGCHRSWYLERFPGGGLCPGWLERLVPVGVQAVLSWHAERLPAAWALDHLRRRLVQLRAGRLAEGWGVSDPRLANAIAAAESLRRRLAEGRESVFSVGLYLTVSAGSRPELDRAAACIEAAAAAARCGLVRCTFRQLDGRLATLPLACDRLGRRHLLDTSSTATLFPWFHAEVQDPGGLVVGRNAATGQPVLVDPFDGGRYPNANIAVVGHSGAGKTHLLSTLAMGALGLGVQVLVIDPEDEYGALARLLGGQAVRLVPGSGEALNVLDLGPGDRGAVQEAVEVCSGICGGLDAEERELVAGAARAALQSPRPVLADLVRWLPRESRVGRALGGWASGELGQLFGRPSTVDLEAPMVAFELRDLRRELAAPVHHLLVRSLWARIRRRDCRRLLILDELGLLFEDPGVRSLVAALARRVRKYDAGLVFGTQNAGDLLATEAGEVVATNPAILFLGAQRPRAAARLQRAFGLSPIQRARLEEAGRGRFLLCAGAARLGLEVLAPPWQMAAMVRARSPYNHASVTTPPHLVGGRCRPGERSSSVLAVLAGRACP